MSRPVDAQAPGRSLIRADRPGVALLVVMLVTLVVGAIAAGAALIGANTYLINDFDRRQSLLESVADAGLELNRARLNANPGLYRDNAIVTLELDAAVTDADGTAIPGVTRTVYVLPVGGGAGEFGNFAALVAIAQDGDGSRLIRRVDLMQESFATFAYFTDFEADDIAFGNKDQLWGPVHSNAKIEIRSDSSTFHGPVTTADRFIGAQYATFHGDTASGVPMIPMPTLTQINRLKQRATPGNLAFTSPTSAAANRARMRIEFVARALGGSSVRTGFVRVYTSNDGRWVTGNVPTGGMGAARQCGRFPDDGRLRWDSDTTAHRVNNLQSGARSRCFLGGADTLWTFIPPAGATGTGPFFPDDGFGSWMPTGKSVPAAVAGQRDADYLFPLDRTLNPAFRGVIFVDGSVVVSGRVRGRVTLVATGNIIIGDDLTYDTDPGGGTCRDALGLIAGGSVVVADNMLNTPQLVGGAWRVYDETPDEHIHATMLALDRFLVENHSSDPRNLLPCNGLSWGRGCLRVNGGIVQRTRGAVASIDWLGRRSGYSKQYTFDQCAWTDPPPYFPGTGHFRTGRYYEVDPTGFDIQAFFRAMN
jgi:hypothetical protein